MRVELTGHQLDITPALRTLVESKLVKLERLMDDVAVSALVVLFSERASARVEMSLHARGERFLHSTGVGDDLRAAIGSAVDKLVQQGRTVKGKWQARQRHPARPASRALKGAKKKSISRKPVAKE
jgi:putative sigma-54 modulation protein